MKILHTSDWHVGRSFHGTSTLEPLGTVLDALVQVVKDREIDVVAIAGDVFDTATPSRDAYSLLSRTLGAIRDAGAVVVLTSGNHDSAERLGFLADFTARAGLHIATRPEDLDVPIVLEDEHGPVYFYGVPYLEPRLIAHRFPEATLRTQEDAMRFALGRIGAANPAGVRSVVLAHTFVSAGARSSEVDPDDAPRDFSQGGVDIVPLDLFDDVTYAALGHLHGRITLSEHVRYSGAPLYYAFGDVDKKRGGWLVELGADGLGDVGWVDLPIPRPLAVLAGTIDELLTDEALEPRRESWVRAILTDNTRPMDAMRRLQVRFPYCVQLEFRPAHLHDDGHATYAQRVAAKSDEQIVEGFLERVRGGEGPTPDERTLIDDVIAQQRVKEATK